MRAPLSRISRQAGVASGLQYILLTIVVVALVIGGLSLLWKDDSGTDGTEQAGAPDGSELPSAAAPDITPVDLQQERAEQRISAPPRSQNGDAAAESGNKGAVDLFERGTRKVPLTDGLAGGSEALVDRSSAAPPRANGVDAFDFGVLDGRVRVGVFGKGPIPDYRASVGDERIVIEMPGDFRYVEEFGRALEVEAFGVDSARLQRDARGMRMIIDVTAGLKYQPFLVEDPRGLMVAFEPKK